MCGILGIKSEKNQKYKNIFPDLKQKNQERGGIQTTMFNTPIGTFYHFRAPTSGANLHNLSEAYPLTYYGYGLIGNGVINHNYFQKIKDENNTNDLYYLLKGISNYGITFLEQVQGCFALAIFIDNGSILLVSNTYPIYYTSDIFSSVEFQGSFKLEHGTVYDWTNDKIIAQLNLTESPFLI